MKHRLTTQTIDSKEQLRELLGEPLTLTKQKIATRLNRLTRRYIELSPFFALGTSDAQGTCDVSPRGDPRGFVRILDEHTLLVPERPGNRLADSLTNILENPHVALLFVIPGVTDMFRVNGRATITTDSSLLAPCEVEGKVPKLGILVDVESAYTHCSKALLRSHLWDSTRHLSPKELPTGGEVNRELHGESFDADEYDRERDKRYARREGFY